MRMTPTETRSTKVPPAVPETAASPRLERLEIPIESIVADDDNRRFEEDEDFQSLLDSVRVLGVLQAAHVVQRADGRYQLIDGERRWRAAQRLGLASLPCEVWPAGAHPRDAIVAGVVLNEQRKAHGSIHVARRLRQVKNQFAETQEQLAARTGLSLDRVRTYMALFNASDALLTFFEERDPPLKLAVELMRYEKATNEAEARRLIRRHLESPLTIAELVALRKRREAARRAAASGDEGAAAPDGRARPLVTRIEAAYRRDAKTTVAQLTEVLGRLGFRLEPAPAATSEPVGS